MKPDSFIAVSNDEALVDVSMDLCDERISKVTSKMPKTLSIVTLKSQPIWLHTCLAWLGIFSDIFLRSILSILPVFEQNL